ncbi:PREDICTED: uncharacterized protein LOC106101528 [Papilio polytes]|uniref:uncharacterized protein LOC106101528 n=1 Tax=Papilio polytes TaxID=76194 RepID=UPI000675D664|nr:PREDICTED: uncharacterized protein LOC106101528 [Papilio polytes]
MEKLYDNVKTAILTFKLDTCCCFAPIRTGVLITGYFNIFISMLSLVGTADGGITPPLMAVQEVILDDEGSKVIGTLAYGTELAFNMLLLCAIYRKDIVLLRTYMYFGMAAIVASVLVYSMVIAAVTLLTKINIIVNFVFQCYVILLVRSAIVDIKEELSEQNGHITLYSVTKMTPETTIIKDIETPQEPDSDVTEDDKNEEKIKLETVNENSKEEHVQSVK